MEELFSQYGMKIAMVCLGFALFVVGTFGIFGTLIGAFVYGRRLFRFVKRKLAPVKPLPTKHLWRSFQKAYAFLVEIEGFTSLGFCKVAGLSWTRGRAGLLGDCPITLSRGLQTYEPNLEMIAWMKSGEARHVTVRLLSRDGERSGLIELGRCTPIRYYLPDLDNASDSNVLESLMLQREPNSLPEIQIGA